MAAILDAILNISISPMMPRWHHSVSMYGHIGENIYAKTFCADYFFGLHPKCSFGNQTTSIIDRTNASYDRYKHLQKQCEKGLLACLIIIFTLRLLPLDVCLGFSFEVICMMCICLDIIVEKNNNMR